MIFFGGLVLLAALGFLVAVLLGGPTTRTHTQTVTRTQTVHSTQTVVEEFPVTVTVTEEFPVTVTDTVVVTGELPSTR